MRIAFFGLPLAALLLARDGHTIANAAICRRGAIGTRRLTRLLGRADVAVKPDITTDAFATKVRDAKPDLVVSWFWTTRLPMRLVDLAPLGGFGVHPSLLPRHRGPDPYFWAIDAGDDVTGVTAHRIAEEYDTGAMLGQKTLRIDTAWNAWTLAKKLDRPSLALLREVAQCFARGTPPREVMQDDANATEAPAIDEDSDLLEIDWTWSSERIARRVRAASPHPGAYTFFGDEPITLVRVMPSARFPKVLSPGQAAVMDGRPLIRTGDGALELIEGRGGEEGEYPLDREAMCEAIALLQEPLQDQGASP